MGPEQQAEVIHTIASGVLKGRTLDDILLAVVDPLAHPLKLWRAALCSIGEHNTRIESLWAPTESLLPVGSEIAFNLTDETLEVAQKLFEGNMQMFSVTHPGFGLLENVLRTEGVACWVAIPLRAEDRIAGILVLASSIDDAFDPIASGFLQTLGLMIEQPVTEIFAATGSV